jgi:hypothetical protein
MPALITTAVGVVLLVVGWITYRRFSARDDEVRRGRLKRRAQGMREASGGAAKPPATETAEAPDPGAAAGGSPEEK